MIKYLGIITPLLLSSCAGPANPFGAKSFILTKNKMPLELPSNHNRSVAGVKDSLKIPTITFDPPRKFYHERGPLKIKLYSPLGLEKANLQFYYNNLNVTAEVMKRSRVTINNNTTYEIEVKRFKLPLSTDSVIKVKYVSNLYNFEQSYEEPNCNIRNIASIIHTSPFNVRNEFLGTVQSLGKSEGINPSLMAGLIAKESGFNPKAVSYAKAIGLTQVTNLAGPHILDKYNDWPEYPQIDELSVPAIKTLITIGKINELNEWRLNKRKSVIGAMTYIKYLESYWDKQSDLIGNISEIDLILASYNSGAFRVKKAIQKDPILWKKDDELGEANKYIKMVKSYCDAFSLPYRERI